MSRGTTFRELEDKLLPTEVGIMSWSPKMDLLSVANVGGDVILYRLSWQKVWTLETPGEGVQVTSLFWRPDGKALAVGYSNSSLVVCDTEDKEILISHTLKNPSQLLQWVAISDSYSNEELDIIFKDDADVFLPSLQSLNKGYESSLGSMKDKLTGDVGKECRKLECQSCLNLLVCITQSGTLYYFAFGIFLCLEFNFELAPSAFRKFHAVSFSNDYSLLTVILENKPAKLQMLSIKVPVFNTHKQELHILATKYVILTSHYNYLASTIRSITESWEEIVVEIDAKLAKYAAEKKLSGCETVSDDFLELLMFGNPSKELEKFLLHDLSEKGLKKLGHSIELTYSNIQKLVLKHVQPVGLAIYYHLVDLCGMAQCSERFSQLGLTKEKCESCLRVAGSFMLKATEVQQVIDYSMINFKAFFRWLYGAILRLSDEPIPSEIAKTSEQDLDIVAQFLKDHFSQVPTGAEGERFCFNLERVGQYLKDEDLIIIQDQANNPWVRFLNTNSNLKNDPLLFPYRAEKSLIQQHDSLQKEFEDARKEIAFHNSQSLVHLCTQSLPTQSDLAVGKVLHMFNKSKYHQITYVANALPSEELYFILMDSTGIPCESVIAIKIYFEDTTSCEPNRFYKVQDFQFYNEDVISILLVKSEANSVPVLVQLPIKELLDRADTVGQLSSSSDSIAKINGWTCIANSGGTFYRLNGVIAHAIEVSGTRHVACVTFISKRRLRLLEMDVEDEDEEENEDELGNPPEEMDNITNSSKDSGLDCSERMEESDENKENCRDSSLND